MTLTTTVDVAKAVTAANLDPLVGQTVDQFCGKYGTAGDKFNHCAHFVSHYLGLRITKAVLCSNAENSKWTWAERHDGFCIRVNQVYNALNNRTMIGPAEELPLGTYIVAATIEANIEKRKPVVIGEMSLKHIGFLVDGTVYHYSNTADKIVKMPLSLFRQHYGKPTLLMRADLPA